MAILGIYDGHNAGAAILSEDSGEVIAAVEEERFSRIKNHDGRSDQMSGPLQSVAYCVDFSSEPISRIALAIADPVDLQRISVTSFLNDVAAGQTQRLARAGELGILPYDLIRMPLITQRKRRKKSLMAAQRAGVDLSLLPIHHVSHHRAHAAGAFFLAPTDRALVVTLDGKGDNLSGTVSIGNGADLQTIVEIDALHSLGHLYSAFTVACGFRPQKDEGKLMALAAKGTVDPQVWNWLSRVFGFESSEGKITGGLNGGFVLGPYPDRKPNDHNDLIRTIIRGVSVEDSAATVQSFVENSVLNLVQYHLGRQHVREIAVSGGVFANVGVNRKLAELSAVDHVFVHPAMTDSGLAVGAAADVFARVHRRSLVPLKTAGLGPCYEQSVAVDAFREVGYQVTESRGAEAVLGREIGNGNVVARFSGAVEYGPRALGNRSILAPTDRPDLLQDLNVRLGRSSVMPFAPMVSAVHASAMFRDVGPLQWSSQFMTTALLATPEMRAQSPCAVHQDGTARPQIVQNDPALAELLRTQHRSSGRAAIINTSFNLHDEPIVCSPRDAARTAAAAEIVTVQVGDVVCTRRNGMTTKPHT